MRVKMTGPCAGAPKTPNIPENVVAVWFAVLVAGQFALGIYDGREWVVVGWTLAWLGVAALVEHRRFARWWKHARRRHGPGPG